MFRCRRAGFHSRHICHEREAEMNSNKQFLIVLLTLALGVTSCATVQATPTASMTPSPAPTYTPSPTATPEPLYAEIKGERVRVDRIVHGVICNDTWSGIVYVDGDIFQRDKSPDGSPCILEIKPGTEVYRAANSDVANLDWVYTGPDREGINTTDKPEGGVRPGERWRDELHHVSIITEGILHIDGTEEKPVLITSAASEPTIYDANYFGFWNGYIHHAIIEYGAGIGLSSNTEISDSTIANSRGCGICIMGHNSNPVTNVRIIGNQLYGAGHELIDVHYATGLEIVGNLIGPNQTNYPDSCNCGAGIVLWDISGVIRNNIFKDCSAGSLLFLSEPIGPVIIEGNIFSGNETDIDCAGNVTYCKDHSEEILRNNVLENPSFYSP